MELSDIKTVEQAKALAFDQLMILEQTQRNLQALNARITELSKEEVKKGK